VRPEDAALWRLKPSRDPHVPNLLVLPPGRGLHSSTFQLNVSASRGIGGAFRDCLRGL